MDKLVSALDNIQAENGLKKTTAQFLYRSIQSRDRIRSRTALKKCAVALASLFVTFLVGMFSYALYFTPITYVDMDVNPSIELILNRFNRVVGSNARNDGGVDILQALSIKHKRYEVALAILMEVMTKQGYLSSGGLVSVTLQTEDKNRENELLAHIQAGLEDYGHRYTVLIDVFSVSGEVRSYSHEQGISPAKYLAIQELIEADPTASVESCRGHSISEIKQMTQEHSHHNNAENHNEETKAPAQDGEKYIESEATPEPTEIDSHHGRSSEQPHHGGRHH